jgi:hypothetical protein
MSVNKAVCSNLSPLFFTLFLIFENQKLLPTFARVILSGCYTNKGVVPKQNLLTGKNEVY